MKTQSKPNVVEDILNNPSIPFFRSRHLFLKVAMNLAPLPKPTLFSGAGTVFDLCNAIEGMGLKRVLIVTDKVLLKIGLVEKVTSNFNKDKVEIIIYDGILPDPTFDQVQEGITIAKNNQCDAVLAIGGGSSIDAAKVIAAGVMSKKPIDKLIGVFKVKQMPLPFFAIPTTAGTGSEVTFAAVISDSKTHEKSFIADPKLVPISAALDSTLMTGMPPSVTSTTGMDALTHAIEAYISRIATDETDRYALLATKLIFDNLTKAYHSGDNLRTRHNMALAAHYAGLAFTKASVGYVHAISHNLGAEYKIPHGLGNAIVLPYVLDFSMPNCTERLANIARFVGIENGEVSDIQLAKALVDRIRQMNQEMDIPEKVGPLLSKDIPKITKAALWEAGMFNPVPRIMNTKQCHSLLESMLPTEMEAALAEAV